MLREIHAIFVQLCKLREDAPILFGQCFRYSSRNVEVWQTCCNKMVRSLVNVIVTAIHKLLSINETHVSNFPLLYE